MTNDAALAVLPAAPTYNFQLTTYN